MESIPFTITYDENNDTVFTFNILNNSIKNPKVYKVILILDELADSLLVYEECKCDDMKYRNHRCKHVEYCLEQLSKYLKHFNIIDYRENEEERAQYEIKHNIVRYKPQYMKG